MLRALYLINNRNSLYLWSIFLVWQSTFATRNSFLLLFTLSVFTHLNISLPMDTSFIFLAQISFLNWISCCLLVISTQISHRHLRLNAFKLWALILRPPPQICFSFIYFSGKSQSFHSVALDRCLHLRSPHPHPPGLTLLFTDVISCHLPRLCAPAPRACSQYLKCEEVPSRVSTSHPDSKLLPPLLQNSLPLILRVSVPPCIAGGLAVSLAYTH